MLTRKPTGEARRLIVANARRRAAFSSVGRVEDFHLQESAPRAGRTKKGGRRIAGRQEDC